MKKFLPFLFILFPLVAVTTAEEKTSPSPKIEQVTDAETKNMYKLSNDLYRSAQPDRKGFNALEKKGIKSVLNLREYHTDNSEAKYTSIKLYKIALAAGSLTEKELLNCLVAIEKAPKPVLVHCWHGSDRTGAVCAAYRIVKQNWEVKDAIEEFTKGPFGFHSGVYGNLPKLLNTIDWGKFKTELAKQLKPAKP